MGYTEEPERIKKFELVKANVEVYLSTFHVQLETASSAPQFIHSLYSLQRYCKNLSISISEL